MLKSNNAAMDKHSTAYYDWIEENLKSAVLADVMDQLGYRHQSIRGDIRPLDPRLALVGRAATMLAAEVYQVPQHPYKLELVLLDSLKPGEIIVCNCQGSKRAAIWGELLATAMRARGGRGVVMDGPCRDAAQLIEMEFPIFARGMIPADSRGRLDIIDIRVPIEVGGVAVQDGDLVVCDLDGCVVVPQMIEHDVIRLAMEKVSGENIVRELLRQGKSIQEVFDQYGIL